MAVHKMNEKRREGENRAVAANGSNKQKKHKLTQNSFIVFQKPNCVRRITFESKLEFFWWFAHLIGTFLPIPKLNENENKSIFYWNRTLRECAVSKVIRNLERKGISLTIRNFFVQNHCATLNTLFVNARARIQSNKNIQLKAQKRSWKREKKNDFFSCSRFAYRYLGLLLLRTIILLLLAMSFMWMFVSVRSKESERCFYLSKCFRFLFIFVSVCEGVKEWASVRVYVCVCYSQWWVDKILFTCWISTSEHVKQQQHQNSEKSTEKKQRTANSLPLLFIIVIIVTTKTTWRVNECHRAIVFLFCSFWATYKNFISNFLLVANCNFSQRLNF